VVVLFVMLCQSCNSFPVILRYVVAVLLLVVLIVGSLDVAGMVVTGIVVTGIVVAVCSCLPCS
jgi:hypothetical protein